MQGVISNPPSIPRTKLRYANYDNVSITRLDSLILNAGIGGWTSLNWLGFAKMLIRDGLVEATTFPDYKLAEMGKTLSWAEVAPRRWAAAGSGGGPRRAGDAGDAWSDQTTKTVEKIIEEETVSILGEVFTANVFGHYVFAHEILPLTMRPGVRLENKEGGDHIDGPIPRARIIWQSSIEPMAHHLDPADIQGLNTHEPYESSKRLTDVLALSHDLSSVKVKSRSFFSIRPSPSSRTFEVQEENAPDNIHVAGDTSAASSLAKPPRMLVAHPGIVVTTIFPLHWFFTFWYRLITYLARLAGSPWHTCAPYLAAWSSVWLALEADAILDYVGAEKSKWGSACDRWGKVYCKRSEVGWWGWEGKVVEDIDDDWGGNVVRVMRKKSGRWSGSKNVTREELDEFEVLGARCWDEMERLRREWDGRVRVGEEREWRP